MIGKRLGEREEAGRLRDAVCPEEETAERSEYVCRNKGIN